MIKKTKLGIHQKTKKIIQEPVESSSTKKIEEENQKENQNINEIFYNTIQKYYEKRFVQLDHSIEEIIKSITHKNSEDR